MSFYQIIEKLISHWRMYYFSELLLMITCVLCIRSALKWRQKDRLRVLLLTYFMAGGALFFLTCPLDLFKVFTVSTRLACIEICNTLFELVEFIVFYHFFNFCLCSKNARTLLKLFLIVLVPLIVSFLLWVICSSPRQGSIVKVSGTLNALESAFLCIICLAYFYQLITQKGQRPIVERESFHIFLAIFFYAVLTIPFFITLYDVFQVEKSVYYILTACHYALLTILLLTIRSSFFRKKQDVVQLRPGVTLSI